MNCEKLIREKKRYFRTIEREHRFSSQASQDSSAIVYNQRGRLGQGSRAESDYTYDYSQSHPVAFKNTLKSRLFQI